MAMRQRLNRKRNDNFIGEAVRNRRADQGAKGVG
jgi:hypothetical protein